MSDETKKVDMAREDRIRDANKQPVKPRPKETDFDKLLDKGKLLTSLTPQVQSQSKTATEEAIREAVKQDDRHKDEGKHEEGEGKEGRDSGQKGEKSHARVAEQRVIAKGQLKEGGGQRGGGEGSRDGSGSQAGRRSLTKLLTKGSTKTLPVDLQTRFAARILSSQKSAAAGSPLLTQQILNKIVQFVRIGLNKKGEKEMQIDLHEKIFKGMKLRVIARGGKVAVHFSVSDKKGREVIEKNTKAIHDALKKKGIEVDEILIN